MIEICQGMASGTRGGGPPRHLPTHLSLPNSTPLSLGFSSSGKMGLIQSQARPGRAPPQPSLAAKTELDAYAQDRQADSYEVQSDPVQYWATE